jgi:hypothetical protein
MVSYPTEMMAISSNHEISPVASPNSISLPVQSGLFG